MYLHKDVLYLKQLNEQIRHICIMRFFEEADKDSAEIYERLAEYCQGLTGAVLNERQNLSEKKDTKRKTVKFRQNATDNMSGFNYINEAGRRILNTAIYRAYGYKNKEDGEDDILCKRASFLEWQTGENPYRELQQICRKEKSVSAKDITRVWQMLEKIMALLEVCKTSEELCRQCRFLNKEQAGKD